MLKGSVLCALLLVSGYNKWILYNSYKKTNANANAKAWGMKGKCKCQSSARKEGARGNNYTFSKTNKIK